MYWVDDSEGDLVNLYFCKVVFINRDEATNTFEVYARMNDNTSILLRDNLQFSEAQEYLAKTMRA